MNRITEKLYFWHKNQKTNLKKAKTKNPNAHLLIEEWYIPLACLHPRWHYTTLLDTAVKVTTWSFVAKNFQMGLLSIMSHTLCFGLLCSISNFHWKYCNFFTKNYNIFILACHTKFLILIVMIWSMIWSMICDLVCDPVRDPVCDPVRDPVRDPVHDPIQSNPNFVDAMVCSNETAHCVQGVELQMTSSVLPQITLKLTKKASKICYYLHWRFNFYHLELFSLI